MIYNKIFLKQICCVALLVATSTCAYGKELLLSRAAIPSLIDYTRGDGLVQALGVKFKYGSAYRGSDQYVLEATLDGAVQWRKHRNVFFIENYDLNGIEFGWRRFIRPTWLMQSGIRHETVLPSSKSKQGKLNDFPHRGSQVFGFVEFRRAIDSEWHNWLTGRFSGGPSDFGMRAEISYGQQFLQRPDDSRMEMEIFLTFGDREQINNYFGISQSDAVASGFEPINLDGGYRSSGIRAMYRKSLTRSVEVIVKGRMEFYSNEVQKSSLVKDASEASVDTSLIYRF